MGPVVDRDKFHYRHRRTAEVLHANTLLGYYDALSIGQDTTIEVADEATRYGTRARSTAWRTPCHCRDVGLRRCGGCADWLETCGTGFWLEVTDDGGSGRGYGGFNRISRIVD